MAKQSRKSFEIRSDVQKVDEALNLVLGWAIVCTEQGEPYFDLQGDHIPEDAMYSAATDFMENCRIAKEMHDGDQVGMVVFAFPMTADIAKSFDVTSQRTGLMIGIRPNSESLLGKFASGEFTGFSIGGERLEDEELAP